MPAGLAHMPLRPSLPAEAQAAAALLRNGATGGETARHLAIEAQPVSHTIPARLQAGKPRTVEVRVARSSLVAFAQAVAPGGASVDTTVVRAISVRLRPGKSAIAIDASTPETLWEVARPGSRLTGETAVWRFVITPSKPGASELALLSIARVVSAEGIFVETSLPDQVIRVKVWRNWVEAGRRLAILLAVGVASVGIAEGLRLVFGLELLGLLGSLIGL